jgi:hypothetical protein
MQGIVPCQMVAGQQTSIASRGNRLLAGIVNLLVGTKFSVGLLKRKDAGEQEVTGENAGYATCLTPVTSFQVWNRPRKVVRYSPALKRCLRGWK